MAGGILIVDDQEVNRKLVKIYLKKYDQNEIYEAENGLEALEIVKMIGDELAVILLDIQMPVMDGIDFLKIIKSEDRFKNIPVVVLTTDDEKKAEVLTLGADDIIIKPVTEDKLVQGIGKYLID